MKIIFSELYNLSTPVAEIECSLTRLTLEYAEIISIRATIEQEIVERRMDGEMIDVIRLQL